MPLFSFFLGKAILRIRIDTAQVKRAEELIITGKSRLKKLGFILFEVIIMNYTLSI